MASDDIGDRVGEAGQVTLNERSGNTPIGSRHRSGHVSTKTALNHLQQD